MWKQDPSFCSIWIIQINIKDKYYFRVKGWEKIFQANGPKKKAGVSIIIPNKIDIKSKVIKRDGGYFMLIKGKIKQDNFSIFSIYAQNAKSPMFFKGNTAET